MRSTISVGQKLPSCQLMAWIHVSFQAIQCHPFPIIEIQRIQRSNVESRYQRFLQRFNSLFD